MNGESVDEVQARAMKAIEDVKSERRSFNREIDELSKRIVRYQEMVEALKLQRILWSELAVAHRNVATMWKSNIGDGPVIRAKADILEGNARDLEQILTRFEEPKGQTS